MIIYIWGDQCPNHTWLSVESYNFQLETNIFGTKMSYPGFVKRRHLYNRVLLQCAVPPEDVILLTMAIKSFAPMPSLHADLFLYEETFREYFTLVPNVS